MKKYTIFLAIASLFAISQVEAAANHIKNIINNSPYHAKFSTTASKVNKFFTNSVLGIHGWFVVPPQTTVTPAEDFQTINPSYSDERPGVTIDVATSAGVRTSVLTNDGRSSFLTNSTSGPISASTNINVVIDSAGNVTQVPA